MAGVFMSSVFQRNKSLANKLAQVWQLKTFIYLSHKEFNLPFKSISLCGAVSCPRAGTALGDESV